MAPEVLDPLQSYDMKCDVWSSGIVMYFLLVGTYPYQGNEYDQVAKKILGGRE